MDTGADYHGRGIRLLWDLCDTVRYSEPGNQIEVTMQWDSMHE